MQLRGVRLEVHRPAVVTGNEGFLIDPKPRKGTMKTLRASFGVGLFTLAVLLSGPVPVCCGQILVGGAANQTAAPLASVPATGTFFSATLNLPPWPMDWLPPQVPVYAWDGASNVFIVDDRGWDYSASGNAMLAAAGASGGMGAVLVGGPPPLPGSGGTGSTNGGGGTSLPMPAYSPEDLYLTNFAVAGSTNSMVIHPPANVTNGVYDLVYTTNLSPPIAWQWLLTAAAPGPTLLTLTNATNAQSFYQLEGLTNSSAGTDFWIAFPMVYEGVPDGLSLFVSSEGTNFVTVSRAGDPYFPVSFSLSAATGTNVTFDSSGYDNLFIPTYDLVTNYGIHVTASQPVSVYAICYSLAQTTSYTAYPTPMLGTNYCVLARPSEVDDGNTTNYFSQFALLATADHTAVTIIPSATANLVSYSGVSHTNIYTINLNKGDTYQINSSTYTNDVTGTIITSTNPIAVFAGANTADVPDWGTPRSNPLLQEQLPVNTWGNQALALGFRQTNGDLFRLLSATSNTVVTAWTTNEVRTTTLLAGQPYDMILQGPVAFQGSNPIQVAQFAVGGSPEGKDEYDNGDPCEILLPPIGHYLKSYTIYSPEGGAIFGSNFLNLIVPQSAITNTFLDGASITNYVAITNFVALTNSGYWSAQNPVAAGTNHSVSSSQPIEIEVYGFGQFDAYGYIGGLVTFP